MPPPPVPEAYRDVIGCPVDDLDTPALLLDLIPTRTRTRKARARRRAYRQ